MPEGNPLVAQRQDSTTAYSGIGIAESAMDIYNGVENKSWVEGGLGAVGTGLEALSLAMDPVGTLLQYAVSWLMEHVKPLSDALDWLAGDADQIAAYAATWKNIGKETGAIAQDFWTEVAGGTAGWQGASAEAYRARAQAQQDKIKAAGTGADTIGTVVEVVGVLVGAVREIVRDLVAECVATLIARIPQWVAEIAGTVGVATPHVVASAVALISKWVNRIKDFILKLTRSLEKLKPIMGKLGEIWDAIRKGLRGAPDGAPSTPNGPDSLRSPNTSDVPSGTSTTTPSSSSPIDTSSSPTGTPSGTTTSPSSTSSTPDTSSSPTGTPSGTTSPSSTTKPSGSDTPPGSTGNGADSGGGGNKPPNQDPPGNPTPPQPPKPEDIKHSTASKQHILDGDSGKSGGHRAGTGRPGKSEFPQRWSDQDILNHAEDVARTETPIGPKRTKDANGNMVDSWDYVGERDGVIVHVTVVEGGEIRTAYPEGGDGVIVNPSSPHPPPKGAPPSTTPIYSNPDVGGNGTWTYEGNKKGRMIRMITDGEGKIISTTDLGPA
ncbi:hypothetical protein JOF56_002344 [Kibdelosporangium banguiense]|uniref:Bacterial EndoU nuclease domain-containing protein n=1 Tax=Kibdelosporangium banguiense TaxID=1365924 RepID=A0ABS4TC15_9PSEU|nr:EndoU domain-containing protein [Kibdelosporangium banguiense]MBP2321959.1 hypothetical protein [Kibdelosporangium banguiense]